MKLKTKKRDEKMTRVQNRTNRALSAVDEINSTVVAATAKIDSGNGIIVDIFLSENESGFDFESVTNACENILRKYKIPLGSSWEEMWMTAGWR